LNRKGSGNFDGLSPEPQLVADTPLDVLPEFPPDMFPDPPLDPMLEFLTGSPPDAVSDDLKNFAAGLAT
jgi:hypothetical protein